MPPRTLHEQKSGIGQRTSPQIREFKGLNVTDARQGIDDGEFAWLENAMTIGKGLVQILPNKGEAVATLSQGIASMTGVVLNANPVHIVVGQDGSLTQVAPSGTVTAIAAAGTATTAARVTMWQGSPVVIVDPTKGYMKWDGSSFSVLDASKVGTTLGAFSGRVWIANGRTVIFTGPGSYTDFSPGGGGGSFIMSDEAFPGNITRLLSALEQLWIFGPGAVNALSNVQVVSGIVQFSNVNVITGLGTTNASSVLPFFRAMAMMTQAGIYSLVGVTPQKVSDKLDGLFPFLTLTAETPAAIFFLNQLPVLCFLVTYQDTILGVNRPLLLCFSQGKWFLASQGSLTWITSLLVNGAFQLWGTDGSTIYRCFAADSATAVPYRIQSKLWDFGSLVTTKELFRFCLEFQAGRLIQPTVEIDTGVQGSAIPLTFQAVVSWINNQRQVIPWTNLMGQTVPWVTRGVAQAYAAGEMQGNYLGWTISGTDPPWSFSAAAMEIEPRREW